MKYKKILAQRVSHIAEPSLVMSLTKISCLSNILGQVHRQIITNVAYK